MTQTRISLENSDGTMNKSSKQSQEGEKGFKWMGTVGFLKTVFQQLGILKILSNGWCW